MYRRRRRGGVFFWNPDEPALERCLFLFIDFSACVSRKRTIVALSERCFVVVL